MKSLIVLLLVVAGCQRSPIAVEPDGAIRCKVVGVVDGDTIDVLLPGNVEQRVRLADIDCPELRGNGGQPFSKKAKQFVSKLCFGKYVQVVQTGKHYDRWIE